MPLHAIVRVGPNDDRSGTDLSRTLEDRPFRGRPAIRRVIETSQVTLIVDELLGPGTIDWSSEMDCDPEMPIWTIATARHRAATC